MNTENSKQDSRWRSIVDAAQTCVNLDMVTALTYEGRMSSTLQFTRNQLLSTFQRCHNCRTENVGFSSLHEEQRQNHYPTASPASVLNEPPFSRNTHVSEKDDDEDDERLSVSVPLSTPQKSTNSLLDNELFQEQQPDENDDDPNILYHNIHSGDGKGPNSDETLVGTKDSNGETTEENGRPVAATVLSSPKNQPTKPQKNKFIHKVKRTLNRSLDNKSSINNSKSSESGGIPLYKPQGSGFFHRSKSKRGLSRTRVVNHVPSSCDDGANEDVDPTGRRASEEEATTPTKALSSRHEDYPFHMAVSTDSNVDDVLVTIRSATSSTRKDVVGENRVETVDSAATPPRPKTTTSTTTTTTTPPSSGRRRSSSLPPLSPSTTTTTIASPRSPAAQRSTTKRLTDLFSEDALSFARECTFPERDDDDDDGDNDDEGSSASASSPSWSPLSGSTFHVRTGPNYGRNRSKTSSENSLFDTVCVRGYVSDRRTPHVSSVLPLPLERILPRIRRDHYVNRADDDSIFIPDEHERVPHVLVVRFELPFDAPNLFKPKDDGYGSELVFYLTPSNRFLQEINRSAPMSPATRLLLRWFSTCETDFETRSRFKCMAKVRDLAKHNISMMKAYNGKPVIISQSGSVRSGSQLGARYLEMTTNVHQWPYLAKKGFNTLLPKFKEMRIDLGYTIEARLDEEMPECIMGATTMNYVNEDDLIRIPESVCRP